MVQTLQQFIIEDLNVKPTINPAAEYRARVEALKSYIKAAGVKGVVMELDGDRQSAALAGSIAKRAVGELRAETGDRTYRFIALALPCTNELTTKDDARVREFVNADHFFSHSIKGTVESMMEKHPELLRSSDRDHRDMVARVRTTMKHTYARNYKLVVLGTGNAVENVAGESTHHGTTVCHFLPLAGLVAHQVNQLLHYLHAPADLLGSVPVESLAGLPVVTVDKYLAGKNVEEREARRIEQGFLTTEGTRKGSGSRYLTEFDGFKTSHGSKVLAYA